MKKTLTFFRKNLHDLAISPVTYITVFLFGVAVNLYFVSDVFIVNQAGMRKLFEFIPVAVIVIVPALTMGSWAQEKKLRTLELLLSSPLKTSQLVLGKYLAGIVLILLLLLTTLSSLGMIYYLGNPDSGEIVSGYIGMLLLFLMLMAIGQFVSLQTTSQITAFLLSLIFFGVLYLIGDPQILQYFPDGFAGAIQYFSYSYHFNSIARGIIDLRDVVYFLSITIVALLLAVSSLDNIKRKGK